MKKRKYVFYAIFFVCLFLYYLSFLAASNSQLKGYFLFFSCVNNENLVQEINIVLTS
jgi:hypothetical protein